jgi:predicted nucleic acid-binding Zn ribbon protein
MHQPITRRAARSHLIWWAAYILLVLVMVVSTWALADF